MKSEFLLWSLAITVVNIAGLLALNELLSDHSVPPAAYYFVGGFWLLSIALHKWLTRPSSRDPQLFVSYFMGAITVKLIATLIFLGAYLIAIDEERMVVALSAFVTYVLFTILHVSMLSKTESD